MIARIRSARPQIAAAGALALGLALAGGARAAVVSTMPNRSFATAPVQISFGNNAAGYTFTAASTGNGPGANVATSGNATVSSFFGSVTDFSQGATIDQNGELYGFSAFAAPALIPNSPADDFIGLAFTLPDGLHYGYAEVAGPALVSYGYDTTPGASILTGAAAAVPEPASLGLVLVGALGLAARRRIKA